MSLPGCAGVGGKLKALRLKAEGFDLLGRVNSGSISLAWRVRDHRVHNFKAVTLGTL